MKIEDRIEAALKAYYAGYRSNHHPDEAHDVVGMRAALKAAGIDELLEDKRKMREGLEELMELHETPLELDFRANNIKAHEDVTVEIICEKFGYGAVMDSAARLWHLKEVAPKLTGTGHTIGHNYHIIKKAVEKAKQILAQMGD